VWSWFLVNFGIEVRFGWGLSYLVPKLPATGFVHETLCSGNPATPAMLAHRRDRSSDLASLMECFWWNARESLFDLVVWENYIRSDSA
jgi:hypothetical protein